MALKINHGMSTDHITWEGRGFGEDTPPKGHHTPVDGPGACEGLRFSDIFRRKRAAEFGVRGISSFKRDPDCSPVYCAAMALGVDVSSSSGMWDTYQVDVSILDGYLRYVQPCEGRGFATLDVEGNDAVRLLAHRLGIVQPRRFPDEPTAPDCAELEWRLWQELNSPRPASPTTFHRSTKNSPLAPRDTPPVALYSPDSALSKSEMAFVDELLAIRSTSEFIIVVSEYRASLDRVYRYLATHHPELVPMVEGSRQWLADQNRPS